MTPNRSVGLSASRPIAQFGVAAGTKETPLATVRYLVNNVDESLPFYRALGFKLADRWGPPFAIVKGKGFTLWLSGAGAPISWFEPTAPDARICETARRLFGSHSNGINSRR